jgi:hypothetical protein
LRRERRAKIKERRAANKKVRKKGVVVRTKKEPNAMPRCFHKRNEIEEGKPEPIFVTQTER